MKKLNELFDIRYGNSLELNRLTKCGPEGIPFVSRKSTDNGIAAYVEKIEEIEPNPEGELTCALSGNGILSTFIQDRPYYTAFHVACLRPRVDLSKQELLYYCLCIKANRYRYSYGRQANRTLKDIQVPSPEDIPDWVRSTDINRFANADNALSKLEVQLPSPDTWKMFRLDQLFNIEKGKRLTKADMTPGKTRFIGAIDSNNGITNYIGQPPIHKGNTITVNYNGNGVAEAFYQVEPFWATDDVKTQVANSAS